MDDVNLAVPIDSTQGFIFYVELRRTMMGKIAADEVSE